MTDVEVYWTELQELGRKHDERIWDKEGWCEPFLLEGKTAQEVFYEEFPEHKAK